MMAANPPDPWRAQIEKIRTDIEHTGESILAQGELRRLCPELATSAQWEQIANIAITERWAFTFFPSGDVRFEKL
jgi:hypothetical protein